MRSNTEIIRARLLGILNKSKDTYFLYNYTVAINI